MSLGIVIKSPEGLVLAAESRVTMGIKMKAPAGNLDTHVYFDNATKLLSFASPNSHIGVVTYGQAVIGKKTPRTAASFLPEFESTLPEERLTVEEFAKRISAFYMKQWLKEMPANENGGKPINMSFIVAGYDKNDVLGKVYVIDIPGSPEPKERCAGETFGITFGGQTEIMTRLMMGYDMRLAPMLKKELNLSSEQQAKFDTVINRYQTAVPFQVFALQDCIDLANFYIKTTIESQRLSIGIRGVGGEIDVAIIKRNKELEFIKRKKEYVE
ncbi:MAG: hypothetical protein JXN65_01535 [Clostridia bacterium]|nr:hypothetical protein [Clostridia bacterium]